MLWFVSEIDEIITYIAYVTEYILHRFQSFTTGISGEGIDWSMR